MKVCEVCQKEIPEDYGNLLCDEHYKALAQENARLQALAEEEKEEKPNTLPESKTLPQPEEISVKTDYNVNGITDPNYKENPEAEDKEQWATNIALFQRHGVLLWKPTRTIYEFIKTYSLNKVLAHPQYPKFIWKPKIVDVGCGCGVGSNIISQEADFVWGIDKNEKSIQFAKQAFERIKNGIYYSSQISFDHLDFLTDTREYMKFDAVVAIEVIEHIYDYKKFLTNLVQKFDKRKDGYEATEYFISTPNRNNKSIRKTGPENKFHVREWNSTEFYIVLSELFNKIEFFASDGKPISGYETDHTPLLAKCSGTKV